MAPLKMGIKPETISGNVKELMKAGRPQKEAIAAALSMKRKSMKKMAEGGMVEGQDAAEMMPAMHPTGVEMADTGESLYKENKKSAKVPEMDRFADGGMIGDDGDEDATSDLDQEADRTIGEESILGDMNPEKVYNPEYQDHERMLAKKLFEKSEREENKYAEGGLVVKSGHVDSVGDKPELDWINDGTEEPASLAPVNESGVEHPLSVPPGPELSEAVKQALLSSKKKRRYTF